MTQEQRIAEIEAKLAAGMPKGCEMDNDLPVFDDAIYFRKASGWLIEQLSEGQKDSARIDDIERNSAMIHVFDPPSGDAWVWSVVKTDDDGRPTGTPGVSSDLREAIDDAKLAPLSDPPVNPT